VILLLLLYQLLLVLHLIPTLPNGSTLAHEHTRKSGKLAMILFRVKIARIPGANCTPNRF
jgi:hypothetical protein